MRTQDIVLTSNGQIRRNAANFDDEGIFIGGEANDPQFSLRKGARFFRLSGAALEHNLWRFAPINNPAAEIGRNDTTMSSGSSTTPVVGYTLQIEGSGSVAIVLEARHFVPGTLDVAGAVAVSVGGSLVSSQALTVSPTEYVWDDVQISGPDDIIEVVLVPGRSTVVQPPPLPPVSAPVRVEVNWVSVRARTDHVVWT